MKKNITEMVLISPPVVPQPIYMNADELTASTGQRSERTERSYSMPGQVSVKHSDLF